MVNFSVTTFCSYAGIFQMNLKYYPSTGIVLLLTVFVQVKSQNSGTFQGRFNAIYQEVQSWEELLNNANGNLTEFETDLDVKMSTY